MFLSLSHLICKVGVTLVLALQAFHVEGLKEIMDVSTWHVGN